MRTLLTALEEHILGIDASMSGFSGDMFIAALSQLVPNSSSLMREVGKKLETYFLMDKFEVNTITEVYGDFKGLRLEFNNNHFRIHDNFIEKFYEFVEIFHLPDLYRKFAVDAFEIIISAERDMHHDEKLHLHELGTVDTFFDLLCSAVLLQELNVTSLQISPIATGYGQVKIKHGILPVPAPATLDVLEKYSIPTSKGPAGEALTPTGISMIASMLQNFQTSFNAVWLKHANGFGNKKWNDRGNFVRVRLGKHVAETTSISVLETNLDDVTGEILGHTVQKLLDEGALDVSYYPIFMKKNRPGYCLRVLVNKNKEEKLIQQIHYLTSTLGIRIFEINRHVGKRRIEEASKEINGTIYQFRVKTSLYGIKIEFDDLIRISEILKKSPKETEYLLMTDLNIQHME